MPGNLVHSPSKAVRIGPHSPRASAHRPPVFCKFRCCPRSDIRRLTTNSFIAMVCGKCALTQSQPSHRDTPHRLSPKPAPEGAHPFGLNFRPANARPKVSHHRISVGHEWAASIKLRGRRARPDTPPSTNHCNLASTRAPQVSSITSWGGDLKRHENRRENLPRRNDAQMDEPAPSGSQGAFQELGTPSGSSCVSDPDEISRSHTTKLDRHPRWILRWMSAAIAVESRK